MNKRGVGHLEIILAFVLFVAAVFFALYFFSPVDQSRLIDSSLQYAKDEIIKNTTVGLITYTAKLNVSAGVNAIAINFSSVPLNMNVKVTNSQGILINSTKSGSAVYLQGPFQGNDFITIMFCEDFNNTFMINPVQVNTNYYQIASTNSESIISEKRILELKEAYEQDYPYLKKKFNLPGRINFGFSLDFPNLDKIKSEKEISGQEVYSDNKEVKVLRLNNDIVSATLYVKIW